MWSDNETTVDYLNFGVVADACAKLLQQAKGTPISVGISGGWGVGKTSLVRMIEMRLKNADTPGKNTYVVVTFNPWLYQDFEGARSALLQLVGDEVLRLAAADETLLKKARKVLKRINLLRLAQLGGDAAATLYTGVPVGSIGAAIMKVGGFFELGDKDNADDVGSANDDEDKADKEKSDGLLKSAEPVSLPSEIQAFRDALEELLEELKVTLVVFVDDLDRCLPKTAISTLESIRLLLFLKRSAFVIAADNEFIKGSVRVHFDGTGISGEIETNYFDKLIQVPLHVPRLGTNEAKAYLALLLMERAHADGIFDEQKFDTAKKAIPERLQTSWRGDAVSTEFLQALAGLDNAPMVALMELAEGLAPLLTTSSVKANPRLMKRFLNTVYLRSALAEPQGIKLDIPALAKWHLVERCNEPLANALAALVTSGADGRVPALHAAEAVAKDPAQPLPELFKSSDESFAREWLQLKPDFGEVDLRPLLHLSRDTATREFGADNMTAEGRKLRDALAVATDSNVPLTDAIKAVDAIQAGMAMSRAWQIRSGKRTWRMAEDVVSLIEPCKVYPELGAQAAAHLSEAPVSGVRAGIIPRLYEQGWARPILDGWDENSLLDGAAKRAIQVARKKVK
ncbi:KAP family P-loop NTPase fold protein [Giesbergeria anulus]|uniref:Predicted P-loop ATPase, KAP-like n=1 Tax=Giesbergeria anulus TaxID=180197 RepID=A0A1H9RI11_9BURK|nr:P-loop NTPase fold protein [Giesbergeria anulus]SER72278.1 Predicted P-loop ATPase, KAP-like [Giesbergeria anulus]